ncbi:MAG: FtsW/RodA/SpoVE family cell cycle protein [Alphaproteobacteria bacterium]|nr:FtsW/RodA/SpoVE family cell cycle protein [Alphaproteobacteria bacterium]
MITILPIILIMIQPDLGTSLLILFVGVMVLFFAGVRWWKFASFAGVALVSGPLIWTYLMHDFQRQRILSFLNPENDLLGSGYQLMQSKIAIGSGGLFGLGLLEGSQSLLGFIPAKHTDFIFALFAEQFGFFGSILLLLLLLLLVLFTVQTAMIARSIFGRIVVLSLGGLWIIQSLINLSMVMGLLPVVGIPLPFLSYGGTSLWTSMAGFGFVLSVYINQYSNLRTSSLR